MVTHDPVFTRHHTVFGHKGVAFAGGLLALTLVVWFGPDWLRRVPDAIVLPLADVIDRWLIWFARDACVGGVTVQQITRGLAAMTDAPIRWTVVVLAEGIEGGRGLNRAQILPPLSWFAIGGTAALAGWRIGRWRLALTVVVAVAYLVLFGLWTNAMITLASVLVSGGIATILGLALGIWSWRSEPVERFVRALMNVMQTVPIFAYLIPTLLLFGYGPSAALIATVAYALPPMVHNAVIALRSVPPETVEGGIMSGCTRRQLLWQVQLPAALPQLALGLNQVVMMTLNMVIIASMIGAGGLGYDVLTALRKLDIGTGLEAGMAIVALAVVLDRIGQAAARRAASGKQNRDSVPLWMLLPIWLVVSTMAALVWKPLQTWPKGWTLSTAGFWNAVMTWINTTAFDTIEGFRAALLLGVMRPARDALAITPWSLILSLVIIAGYALGGLRLAASCGALAAFVVVTGLWDPAMNSLYLLGFSVLLALGLGYPLGFWIGLRPRLHKAAGLMLDTLQTIPTLVYLLPAIILFRIGDVSAVIAIASYAFAAAVRYAMAAMTQVPESRIEAAKMSGCTAWQTFLWVRLPSSWPTLIVGVNQTVMMAFSMLVISALVGTRDLGQQVLVALNQSKVGEGIVAGLAVAALALIADGLLKAAADRLSDGRTEG
jgi:glycine betaine/proline transport system permease protein